MNALLHTTRGAPSRESEDLGDPSNAFPPGGRRAPSVTTTRRREQAEDGIVDGRSVACRSAPPRIGSEVVRELLIAPVWRKHTDERAGRRVLQQRADHTDVVRRTSVRYTAYPPHPKPHPSRGGAGAPDGVDQRPRSLPHGVGGYGATRAQWLMTRCIHRSAEHCRTRRERSGSGPNGQLHAGRLMS